MEFDNNGECKIELPTIVFTASNQEEEHTTRATDDDCDADCESFDTSDLMKLSWQIACGMVNKILIPFTSDHYTHYFG